MALKNLEADTAYKGTVSGIALDEDKNGDPVIHIYVEVSHRYADAADPDSAEEVTPFECGSQLFFGGIGEGDERKDKRRGISREQIATVAGLSKLADSFKTLEELCEGGKVFKALVGKEVNVKGNPVGDKVFTNLHFFREKRKGLTVDELKKKWGKGKAKSDEVGY